MQPSVEDLGNRAVAPCCRCLLGKDTLSALADRTQDVDAFHTSHEQQRDWYGIPDAPQRNWLLDKPSDPHPILSLLMDEALLRIILTSDGAVMALKERLTGSKEPGAPTSSLAELVSGLDERFAACKTHRARLTLIKEAQFIADRLCYAPRADQRGTVEWKAAIGRDDRSCRVVASVYGVSLRDVVAYRKQYGVTKLAKREALP